MRKKIIATLFYSLIATCYMLHATYSLAIDCKPNIDYSSLSNEDKQNLVTACQQKVSDLQNQASTLSSRIQFYDTQIYLTTLRISATELKIVDTQKEIDLIDTHIVDLDKSLNTLSQLLIERIVQGYKTETPSLFNLFFADNAADFLDNIKYQKTTQDNNQKLLLQVQESKLNFEDQKKQREKKKEELAQLKNSLDQQKVDLKNQQAEKRQLLAATQNDEATYQGLLEKARQELAGFSAFASAAGGGLTSFGSGSNGWYYTQRDPAWGNMKLPGSSSSVLLAGCAVTSVAMVCKSYGQGITPASIVSNSSNFIGGDLWNWAFNCSGKSASWLGASKDSVKSYVEQNTPVILRLYAPSVSGLHFVVAWKVDGSDFIIHDPYYGPDKKFSERYNWSQVTNAVAIR